MSGVCAVVVSFHTGRAILARLGELAPQADHIIIVDNGSEPTTLDCLAEAETLWSTKITIIYQADNIGLSRAQNIGIRIALKENYDWVLLLDDDSSPAVNMVAQMLNHYATLEPRAAERVGILYPSIIDRHLGKKTLFLVLVSNKLRLRTCSDGDVIFPLIAMSSGSLIKTEIFRSLGLMDEAFFIDQIDVDFSLRIINAGLEIRVVGDAKLVHSLGTRRSCNFLWFQVTPTDHSALRCYHIFRNRTIIWKRYVRTNFKFILFDMFMAGYHMFKVLGFERCKVNKISQMFKGVYDGLGYKTSNNAQLAEKDS